MHLSARSRVSRSWLLVPALSCVVLTGALHAQPLSRYAFTHPQMGTQFNIVLYATDSTMAAEAAGAAFARVDTLNQHLSDYLSDSELSRLSATAGTGRAVPVSGVLWTVLQAAWETSAMTDGAFDVTVGPLSRLWRWAMRREQLPPQDRLKEALQAVGYQYLILDSEARTALLEKPGMQLDLGGIAKGYAGDEILRVLATFGITHALADAGGDLVLGEPPPGVCGWRVAVGTAGEDGRRTEEVRCLARIAVATSGDRYRYLEVGGVRYSHIIDPRTGMGLTTRREVTVLAPTGMQADALASAVSVMGDEGVPLGASLPGVGVRMLTWIGERCEGVQTDAFEALGAGAEHQPAPGARADSTSYQGEGRPR